MGVPSLALERTLLSGGACCVVAVDEVGRGAAAGPVSVGVVQVSAGTGEPPARLRDSKLLSAAVREQLVPQIGEWAEAWAVGHASAAEVDEVGIIAALGLAVWRALDQLPCQAPGRAAGGESATRAVCGSGQIGGRLQKVRTMGGSGVPLVLLDGNLDWVTSAGSGRASLPRVVTRVKADLACASVAAASVVAKVARDEIMADLDDLSPGYGLARNKGYLTASHADAIARLGPSVQHRRSWRLPSQT